MIKKKIYLALILLIISLFFINFVFAVYTRSSPSQIQGVGGFFDVGGGIPREQCESGQDFILQIAPFGCSPAVVRSDLLEERDAPVFCQIYATKINPLIDIDAINRIRFTGPYPNGVKGITYVPSRTALGYNPEELDSPILNDIGYVVILLKQQKLESSMPDFVEGEITADILYNIKNAFGLGRTTFYLPQISDEAEWERNYQRYSFWKGRGYVRANFIDENSAEITLYQGFRKLSTFTLNKGETSQKIRLPGFDCAAGLTATLNSLDVPDSRARLNVNGDITEVTKGEKFLNDQCTVLRVEDSGLVESVELRCGREKAFKLILNPRVKIDIDGTEREVQVGEFLYEFMENNERRYVYLGYAGLREDFNENSLEIYTVTLPESMYKKELEINDINAVKTIAEGDRLKSDGRVNFFGFLPGISTNVHNWLIKEKSYKKISMGENIEFGGKKITLVDFAEPVNVNITENSSFYYSKAKKNFDEVMQSYNELVYPEKENITEGEEALREKIILSSKLQQDRTVVELCEIYEIEYPSTFDEVSECKGKIQLSSSTVSSKSIVVNREVIDIDFKGIIDPGLDDYSVTILIRDDKGNLSSIQLGKNWIYSLGENDFIQLTGLKDNSATLRVSLSGSFFDDAKTFISGQEKTLKINEPSTFGSKYSFTVAAINIKKVAKVTIDAGIDYAGTKAKFPFKIGIEKRGIKLSRDEIERKIDTLNESISDWKDRSEKLGTVVKGLNIACQATNAVLTIKDAFAGGGLKTVARQEVMRGKNGENGWYNKCFDIIRTNPNQYSDVEDCIFDHSSEIERDVENYYNWLKEQNDEIKKLQEGCQEEDAFLTKNINTNCFGNAYIEKMKNEGLSSRIKARLRADSNGFVDIDGEKINVDNLVGNLSLNSSIRELRELELISKVEGSSELNEMMEGRLENSVGKIYKDISDDVVISTLASNLGISSSKLNFVIDKESREYPYYGLVYDDINEKVKIEGVALNTPIAVLPTSIGGEYIATLNQHGDSYSINKLYSINGIESDERLNIYFKKFDSSTYQNPYIDSLGNNEPVLRYFENEPYKGLPAIVPFDLKNGWYVSTKQVMPSLVGENIRAFDESGRAHSFYLCNVGKNGREENRGGDDSCRYFVNGQDFGEFPGLGEGETRSLIINKAIPAIKEASDAYPASSGKVIINGQEIKVGEPAAGVPDLECTDFHSVADCKILFNVCDPVVCPSSRCDLGGKYPVADVVQTGLAGSMFLCLPNFPDVYIPICLTGVKAGIDSWLSIEESYKQCLDHNLKTGETIGICDQIHSIYMCELFWKEALPLAKLGIPKLLEVATGQNTKGGGEYLGVQSALSNADKSLKYFTDYYASNSYKAFQARSSEEVGGEICKAYVSAVLPAGIGSLNTLTEPYSPSQFYAWFDEILYSTAINPPFSQYKVFYHIFAGNDRGVFYRVYLKGDPASSFYQDTAPYRIVASNFIPKGGFKTETIDFQAPSGYKELCVMINNEEKCGFKQVTTDYAINYIREKYLAEQASKKDIESTTECVSGTPSWYGFVNPNLQAGAEEALNPDIYNRDLIRVCSTEAPGKDSLRWVPVGYCDDENIKCWLDKDSVDRAIKNTGIKEPILKEQTKDYLDSLRAEGKYILDRSDYLKEKKNLPSGTSEDELNNRVNKITELLDRVFWPYHQSDLLILRGKTFGDLALLIWEREKPVPIPTPEGDKPVSPEEISRTEPEEISIEPGEVKFGVMGIIGEELFESELFESPIFEMRTSGFLGTGLFSDSFYLQYANNKWFWSLDKNQWIQSPTNDIMSDLGKPVKAPFEKHELIDELKDENYDSGLLSIVGALDNEDLVTEFVTFSPGDNNLFTVKREDVDSLYFKFEVYPNKLIWYWSSDKKTWRPIPDPSIDLDSLDEKIDPVGRLTKENIDLIKSLENKKYSDGLVIIFGANPAVISIISKERPETDLVKVIEYAKENTLVKRRCNCGEECVNYAKLIIEASDDNEIQDPILLLSLMMQESSCNKNAGSSTLDPDKASIGLMQISLQHCGKYGLPSDKEACRNELLTNPEKNIKIGTRILYENYKRLGNSGVLFKGCEKTQTYYGWEAALRAYNGLGCGKDAQGREIVEQDSFVEEVMARYLKLFEYANS